MEIDDKIVLALITIIVSAIVSIMTTILIKKFEFKSEYYKEIIKKRLETYKYLEIQISLLNNVSHNDKKDTLSHQIFHHGNQSFIEFQYNLMNAMNNGIWLTDEIISICSELRDLLYPAQYLDNEDLIKFSEENFLKVREVKNKLENKVRNDILELHNIKNFKKLMSKKS